MEIIAINGSARKNGNTATMLRNYLEGVSSVSEKINTRIINLYDLQYTGCIDRKILTPKRFPVTMIYTMNVTKELIGQLDYLENWKRLEDLIGRIFSPPQTLYAYNTFQVNNYSNFKLEIFSESTKAEYRRTQFPLDCRAAYENGKETAESLLRSQI